LPGRNPTKPLRLFLINYQLKINRKTQGKNPLMKSNADFATMVIYGPFRDQKAEACRGFGLEEF
jgi:hypothetical protein